MGWLILVWPPLSQSLRIMEQDIRLLRISRLKGHESTNSQYTVRLTKRIKEDGCLKKAIIADRGSLVILDGHHRLQALKRLGCKKIPVLLVDYQDKDIEVYLRRKEIEMKLIKEAVLKRGNNKKPFPYKTTRHLLRHKPIKVNIDLENLR